MNWPGIFQTQSVLIWVQGPDGLGKLRHFSQFGNFHYCHQLRNSCPTWIYIVSFVYYVKPAIVIFECQGICELKRKNYWKFGVLQTGEFHLLFGKIQALFPLGMRPKFGPQNSLEKSLWTSNDEFTVVQVTLQVVLFMIKWPTQIVHTELIDSYRTCRIHFIRYLSWNELHVFISQSVWWAKQK